MRLGRSLLLGLLLVATSCASSTGKQGPGENVAGTSIPALDIRGKPCTFGAQAVPSITLGLGPIAVTIDAKGKLSFSLSGKIVAFGPLSLSATLETKGEQPSCVTLALSDSIRKRIYYIAIESVSETVIIRGGGRFEQAVGPGLVTIETSQLCELQLFTSSQDVPPRRAGCRGSVGYWTVTDSSYDTRAQADVRVKQLQGRGLASVGSANTDDWPSVCPPYFIVYVGQFTNRDGAERRKTELKGVLYADAYSRFVSTDVGDRPAGCAS